MKSPALFVAAALGCALNAASHGQSATDRRFYAGVDIGQAELDRAYPGFYFGPRRESESLSWKLRFGYQFSPRFALETAYTNFGDYDGSGMVVALPTVQAPGDYTTSVKGMELSAVGTWPLGEVFYLNATAGIQRREFRSSFDPSIPYQPGFRARDGDLAAQWGLGFGFRLTEALDAGVNWVTTQNIGGGVDYLENAADPSMVTAGLRVRF